MSSQNHKSDWGKVKASEASLRITNPIRDLVDKLKIPPNPSKTLISLSIGDPTIYGNLLNPANVNEAIINNIRNGKMNGYTHSAGHPEARETLAKKYSYPDLTLTADDIIITSGCSGALEIAMGVLGNPGDSILLPAPGFSIYQMICEHKGINFKYYRLLPEKNWEIDLDHLESLIDETTVAILVNNPSNPCGSVFSKEHILQILQLADHRRLPIIADEIYEGLVFEGHKFYALASLTQTVPILTLSGLSKVYLAPGWRVGWIVVHDRLNVFEEVRTGLIKSSQLILGANTVAQSIISDAILNTPQSYYDALCRTLQENAEVLVKHLSTIKGLNTIAPQGAMYMMVGIETDKFKDISDEVDFSKKLLDEELVMVLPGRIFKMENYVRLVICFPIEKLEEAALRIESFCKRHLKPIALNET